MLWRNRIIRLCGEILSSPVDCSPGYSVAPTLGFPTLYKDVFARGRNPLFAGVCACRGPRIFPPGIGFLGFAHDPYFAKGAFFTKERIICWLRTTVDESEMADWYVT